MKLRLGKMKTKDWAEWFGVKPSYLNKTRKVKEKFYERFKFYCDFEPYSQGVIIKKIYHPVCDKALENEHYEDVLKNLKQTKTEVNNYLSSISNLAASADLSNYHTKKIMQTCFGQQPIESEGALGRAKNTWAIKLEGNNNYRFLTQAEQIIFNDLCNNSGSQYKQLYETATDYNAQDSMDLKQEITKNFYAGVIKPFKDITGFTLVHIKYYEVDVIYNKNNELEIHLHQIWNNLSDKDN